VLVGRFEQVSAEIAAAEQQVIAELEWQTPPAAGLKAKSQIRAEFFVEIARAMVRGYATTSQSATPLVAFGAACGKPATPIELESTDGDADDKGA
jgi:hypothetical protein